MGLAAGLLGAHISERAHDGGLFSVVLLGEGDSEIGQVRDAFRIEQDIGRLDVPVDQVPAVGVGEGVGDGRDQSGRFVVRGTRVADPRGARLPPSMYSEIT